ncbi:restriction endonuclease subunit S [Rothia aeria]|uniref:restriction endonuclease subunit S n=1 Tax=Rothia aeria TaxID=172042 RepID=UPI00254FA2AD|nr:restriction endonuclease subunit S [Rothia aeria]MDK7677934.1 restriction endonuclease subunit S [Rothia aeria]
MNNVRMVKLGDVLTQRKEKIFVEDPLQAKLISVRLYGKGALQREIGDGKVPKAFTGYIGHTGQLVLSRIWARKGAIALIPHDLEGVVVTNEFPLFDVDETQVIPKYLIQLLTSNNFGPTLERASSGSSGQNRVRENKFLEISISLPPLEEQKRIVSILDKAKLIQEARERQLAALDRLKHSLLQETIKSSAIQEIPVGKVISLKSGSFLPAKKQDGGKFPVYGGNGVNGSHSQYMVEEPTIIIGRVGAYCGSVHITRPKSWITDNALIVTIQAEGILQKYLAHVLHSINLNQYANRSGQPSISATRIKDIVIPIIPLTKQENFTKNINNIDRQIYLIRKSLEEDKVLFLSLQSVLFKN